MLRHICMFKILPAAVAETLSRAQSLREIACIRRFEAVSGAPGMPDDNYNFALICDFDDAAALQAYQTHPVHLEFAAYIATVREARACIDFAV